MVDWDQIKDFTRMANENPGVIAVLGLALPLSYALGRFGLRGIRAFLSLTIRVIQNRIPAILSFFISPSETIRIATFGTAFDYLPFEIAKRNGYFRKAFKGRAVEFLRFESLEEIREAAEQNSVDLVFLAAAPAIQLYANGTSIRIFGLSCLHTQHLLSNNQAVRKTRDLTCKPIVSTPLHSSSHFGLIKILQEQELSTCELDIRFSVADDCVKEFRKGKSDVLGVWPLLAERELDRNDVWRVNGSGISVYSVSCVLGGDEAKAKRLSKPALDALQEAKAWISGHKRKAKCMLAYIFGRIRRSSSGLGMSSTFSYDWLRVPFWTSPKQPG